MQRWETRECITTGGHNGEEMTDGESANKIRRVKLLILDVTGF